MPGVRTNARFIFMLTNTYIFDIINLRQIRKFIFTFEAVMALITCRDLSLGYDGKAIVSNLNFKVEKGDYLYIIGANGSGKSTLMKTLLGLHSPIRGECLFGDGLDPHDIGYLPQQTAVQRDFPASVWEIVLSGCGNRKGFHPFYTKAEKQLAKDNIALLGMTDLTKRCYRELSGGQQQRVLLARALCAAKKLILLDEPVAGLDPNVTDDMYSLIDHLNRDEGVTVIMISHDIPAAKRYATHMLYIGDECFFGTSEEYNAFELANRMNAGGDA